MHLEQITRPGRFALVTPIKLNSDYCIHRVMLLHGINLSSLGAHELSEKMQKVRKKHTTSHRRFNSQFLTINKVNKQ